jgi:mRNA-degrading endonuclease toxin of MazEF toxin-antitoxin module
MNTPAPLDKDTAPANPKEAARYVRHLQQRLDMVWRYNYGEDARAKNIVAPILAQLIADLERNTLVWRPAGELWQLGRAADPVVVRYPNRPRPLLALQAAFASPHKLVDIAPWVQGELVSCRNGLGNAIRDRVVPWLGKHCPIMVDVVKAVTVTRDGFICFQPAGTAPKIVTCS